MERFGDVSGSHSKLLTTFMKKHTGKIKGEFDVISSLEKRTNKLMEDFEEDRRPVADCIAVINKTSQILGVLQQQENDLEKVKEEISRLEVEGQDLGKKLAEVEMSPDFESTSKTIKEMMLAEGEQKEFHKYLIDLFSPVSRALTKYSYGTSKATSSKLHVLMNSPWQIFERADGSMEDTKPVQNGASQTGALESYKSLIVEVQKAVATGRITLKDSQKTIKSFDLIIKSLPNLQRQSELIASKIESLEQRKDDSVIAQAETLRTKLRENKSSLDNHGLYLERLENEVTDKKNNLQQKVKDSERCLSDVTGRNYTLMMPSSF
jgi:DNA-binding protein YbaB